ncbi:hypothetical protein I79_014383 [Cricetulus griseus]|uniref:Uncharacterized protein n=1 Tax=Cricetulus griseus TaxID=10029 RepID=G3HU15_CRIGR|nr:hypothetical protein I79_014383 [Cricetulus griseus]
MALLPHGRASKCLSPAKAHGALQGSHHGPRKLELGNANSGIRLFSVLAPGEGSTGYHN